MAESSIAIFAALADEIRIMRSKMQIDESVHVRPARIDRGTYESSDLIVVRTGDTVLVARRGRGEDVREIVKRLEAEGREDLLR